MTGKLDELFGFQEAALKVRSQRQGILASNIANADTPNYHARDIDFKSALKVALDNANLSNRLDLTDEQHIPEGMEPGQEMVAGVPLLYRTMLQGSVDNNTVDMDVERNQFADNALRYEASVTIISHHVKNMLAVIQG